MLQLEGLKSNAGEGVKTYSWQCVKTSVNHFYQLLFFTLQATYSLSLSLSLSERDRERQGEREL